MPDVFLKSKCSTVSNIVLTPVVVMFRCFFFFRHEEMGFQMDKEVGSFIQIGDLIDSLDFESIVLDVWRF